jgi:hypothetical protein
VGDEIELYTITVAGLIFEGGRWWVVERRQAGSRGCLERNVRGVERNKAASSANGGLYAKAKVNERFPRVQQKTIHN